MSKEIIDSTSADPLHRLYHWFNQVDYSQPATRLLNEAKVYSIVPRENKQQRLASISELLTLHPFFRWYQSNPEQCLRILKQDTSFSNCLKAINEILDIFASHGTSVQNLYILALTERVAELAQLGMIHIPRNFFAPANVLPPSIKPDRGAQPPKDIPELPKPTPNKKPASNSFFERLFGPKKRKKRKPTGNNTSDTGYDDESDSTKNDSNHSSNSRDTTTNKSTAPTKKDFGENFFGLNATHPLLENHYQPGIERKAGYKSHKATVITLHHRYAISHTSSDFIIYRICNVYQAEKNYSGINASRSRIKLFYGHDHMDSRSPLGPIDTEKTAELFMPQAYGLDFEYVVNRRTADEYQVVNVRLEDEIHNTIISSRTYDLPLYVDDLGNMILHLRELPISVQEKLKTTNVFLSVGYKNNIDPNQHQPQTNPIWIGPITKEEQYKKALYPVEIQKMLDTLKRKKNLKIPAFSTNQDIFARLAQFLGKFWITYNLLDAPHHQDDPIGFNQTERALWFKQASCEGSAVTLLDLMRHFVEPGEGLALVDGVVVEPDKSGTKLGTTEDLHAAVMYIDSQGEKYIYDATAWNEATKQSFTYSSDRYRHAKQQWYQAFKGLNEKHNGNLKGNMLTLEAQADVALSAVANSWSIPLAKEYPNIDPKLQLLIKSYNFLFADYTADNLGYGPMSLFSKDLYIKSLGYFMCQRLHIDTNTYHNFLIDPENPISAGFFSKITHLEEKLYDELNLDQHGLDKRFSKNLNDYLSETTDDLLDDDDQRTTLYKLVALVELSQPASAQNIEVLERFTQEMKKIKRNCRARLKYIFSSRKDLLATDINTFYKSAPFLYFVPHPFAEKTLEGFFTRNKQYGKMGYLMPESSLAINLRLADRLTDWEHKTAAAFEKIEHVFSRLQPEVLPAQKTVPVSSLYLWESFFGEKKHTKKDPQDTQLALNPITLFAELCRAFHK